MIASGRPGRFQRGLSLAGASGRQMTGRIFLLRALACLLSFALACPPVAAQSVLRDAETEAFLQDIAAPMAKSAGLAPGALKLALIGDPEINAFVAGGQLIYMQSGTIEAASNANELEGVIAHELGHIEAGDIARSGQAVAAATKISLLSLLLGAAAIAAGAGEAGMAAMMAGQSAAEGKYLAYSRAIEGSADASAVRHLNDAHVSGKGMISFFGKLRQQEYRLSPSYATIDPYAQNHPMTADREAVLQRDLSKSPWWNAPPDAAKEARFQRIKAKLIGYLDAPETVFNKFPDSDQSIPAHYARAYAWHRKGYTDKAVAEMDKLVSAAPHDPYFLELKGQILLESGAPREAIAPLREAVRNSRNTPLIAALLGHALVATEDPTDLAEAGKVLKVAVTRDNENPFAWYNLGVVYARQGDEPRASLASAERFSMENNPRLALANAEVALHGIPEGTPDWLRAQDIAMVSRTAVQDKRKNR